MRRFTDSILFLALFVLSALAWLILANTGGVPAADSGRIAPMTVGAVVVIACPALLLASLLGLARALSKTSPRRFYTWTTGAAVAGSIVAALASVPADRQGVEVGFEWMSWFFGIMALAFVIALIIALTGGIQGPSEKAPAQFQTETAPARTQSPTSTSTGTSSTAATPSSPVTGSSTSASDALPVPTTSQERLESASGSPAELPSTTGRQEDGLPSGRTTSTDTNTGTPAPDPSIHGTATDQTTSRESRA